MREHPQARVIVEMLVKAGYVAYYAGGWVRDFLLQKESDDIDIATSAPPEVIQRIFSHTVPIGIAFGIVLVIVEGHQFEVATFRQDFDYADGRRPKSVQFSSAEEDAKRRDFTINGMFFDPLEKKVLDFVGGRADLEAKVIRAIGDPHARIQEDRLRMMRAVRLACRLHFAIEPATERAIRAHAKELFPAVAIERIWQEFTKGGTFDALAEMLLMLYDFGLLETIFPQLQGTPREEIQKRIKPLEYFPEEAPLISELLELFPHYTAKEALELCQFFKLSRKEAQFVEVLFQVKQYVGKRETEEVEWAHLYANPHTSACLAILGAHLGQEERERFLGAHEEHRQRLQWAIDRIQRSAPLVTSQDLALLGIAPGKQMGALLKAAERIAINEQIQEKKEVLRRLQFPL